MEDRRDRRLDTWIETGRQFVDGVSGRRPGQRRNGFDLDSVGRWDASCVLSYVEAQG